MKTSMNSYHILFDLKNNPFRHMQILTCEDYKLKNVNICLKSKLTFHCMAV